MRPVVCSRRCCRPAARPSISGFVFFGKGGEIATNRVNEQEVSALALHLLQASLVYVNTRMLQTVLVEPKWAGRMTAEDYRGLTPLIYSHVNPYGRFDLDLSKRIDLGGLPPEGLFGI
ncbi:Tn3 family transposase [Agrobacterium sp. NPDC089420]|uniref:Tn3 family transposase n=1 Tax=Agrobacterium sp. NPDC089420 TaxID=3363918 RepID=UPI0038514EC6